MTRKELNELKEEACKIIQEKRESKKKTWMEVLKKHK
jgi:hypothetical protein